MFFVGRPRCCFGSRCPHARGLEGSTVISFLKHRGNWASTGLSPLFLGHRSPPPALHLTGRPSTRRRRPGYTSPSSGPWRQSRRRDSYPPGINMPRPEIFSFLVRGKSEGPRSGTRPNFSRNKSRLANPAFRDDSGTSLGDPYLPLGPALIVASGLRPRQPFDFGVEQREDSMTILPGWILIQCSSCWGSRPTVKGWPLDLGLRDGGSITWHSDYFDNFCNLLRWGSDYKGEVA